MTTNLPEKILTGYDDAKFSCKKMKFPLYKDPNSDCTNSSDNSDTDCNTKDIQLEMPIGTSYLVAKKEEISDFTFQEDFMVVCHESFERLADKLLFNIFESCRYYPKLPLNVIEWQQVFLEFASSQNNKTFPSWREPLIKTDLSSGLDKVIPYQTPICRESFKKNLTRSV